MVVASKNHRYICSFASIRLFRRFLTQRINNLSFHGPIIERCWASITFSPGPFLHRPGVGGQSVFIFLAYSQPTKTPCVVLHCSQKRRPVLLLRFRSSWMYLGTKNGIDGQNVAVLLRIGVYVNATATRRTHPCRN